MKINKSFMFYRLFARIVAASTKKQKDYKSAAVNSATIIAVAAKTLQ